MYAGTPFTDPVPVVDHGLYQQQAQCVHASLHVVDCLSAILASLLLYQSCSLAIMCAERIES